jgi:uncharacterized membrane protein
VLLFTAAAFVTRNVDPATGDGYGFVTLLHLLGVATVSIAGWLGGDMVYRHRLAVHEEAPDANREAPDETHSGANGGHEHDERRRA